MINRLPLKSLETSHVMEGIQNRARKQWTQTQENRIQKNREGFVISHSPVVEEDNDMFHAKFSQ